MAERIAVVGVGQTEFKSKWPEVSQVDLVRLAVKRALENAGITIKEIDAVFVGNMELFEGNYQVDMWLTEGSGAYHKTGMKIQTGGSTGGAVCTTVFDHAALRSARIAGSFNCVQLSSFLFRSAVISSPSSMNAIGPPTAASGPTCPITSPTEPPEKRASVSTGTCLPHGINLSADVTW